ncbi:hypothetical protein A2U01_0089183, partial [Trifolium medium]|nr:hypothetical protein [Trifolium medium]
DNKLMAMVAGYGGRLWTTTWFHGTLPQSTRFHGSLTRLLHQLTFTK